MRRVLLAALMLEQACFPNHASSAREWSPYTAAKSAAAFGIASKALKSACAEFNSSIPRVDELKDEATLKAFNDAAYKAIGELDVDVEAACNALEGGSSHDIVFDRDPPDRGP